MLSPGAAPVAQPVLGDEGDPGFEGRTRIPAFDGCLRDANRAPRGRAAARRSSRRARAGRCRRRPRRRRSRRRARRARRPCTACTAAAAGAQTSSQLEQRLAGDRPRGRRGQSATSRPTISAASDRGVASAVATVATERPPRSTVTRSETAVTSFSLCEMKITVRPSATICRSVANSTGGLLRRQHGGRLVEDQDARVAVERLQDLDPLLLAERELPDRAPAGRRRGRSCSQARRPSPRSGAARSGTTRRPAAACSPSTMFSATVKGSTRRKCWCTIPTPASSASRGLANSTCSPVEHDLALRRGGRGP